MKSHLRAMYLWLGSGLVAALMGCSGGGSGGGSLTDTISQVSAIVNGAPVNATRRSGSPPSGSGPAITATASGVTIPGGSRQIQVSSTANYTTLAVSVSGVDGYFEITGLSGGAVTLLATIAQSAPIDFTIQVFGGTGTAYGTAQAIPIHLTSVGTGDIQVNVSWDVDNDLDLHVVGPNNVEIYYGARTDSATGGSLDLDSNAGCAIDSKRSENITYPSGRAPRGTYTVKVDYWANCPPRPLTTNYVVTVNVKGQAPRVFNGTFSQATDPDHGGAGAGRTITTFTY
jgi:hypothetical protein